MYLPDNSGCLLAIISACIVSNDLPLAYSSSIFAIALSFFLSILKSSALPIWKPAFVSDLAKPSTLLPVDTYPALPAP